MLALKSIKFFFTLLLIFVTHLFFANFFLFPINQINILFAYLLYSILINKSRGIYVQAAFLAYLSELFSASFFGVILITMLFCVFFINWLYINILTGRSLPLITLSAVIAIFCYRLFLYTLITILSLLFNHNYILPKKDLLFAGFWEIILTAIVLSLVYIIHSKFFKQNNPTYV